jgi:hypothetical protein
MALLPVMNVFAHCIPTLLQTLGVTVQLLKLVLFAQLAAAFGASSSVSPLWQVVPLLVLIVLYWLYVRFFVPMASLEDMVGEVSWFGSVLLSRTKWRLSCIVQQQGLKICVLVSLDAASTELYVFFLTLPWLLCVCAELFISPLFCADPGLCL